MYDRYDSKGLVFNIQKFSIHDGTGVRTLVFMKGCPMSCMWCSNPESQSFEVEFMDIKSNCTGCRKCYHICPQHAVSPDTLDIDRTVCNACGKCADVCYSNAKKQVGRLYSVDELVGMVEKDYIMYRNSGGGVTVGGGEPTAQHEFVGHLLKECRSINIHTAIETCGYADKEKFKYTVENADQVFFDLKHMDAKKHAELTGVSNDLILENARELSKTDKEIIFRIPLIPILNSDTENIMKTGEFIFSLMTSSNDIKVEILPYHEMGKGKYDGLNRKYELHNIKTPAKEHIVRCKEILKKSGCDVI